MTRSIARAGREPAAPTDAEGQRLALDLGRMIEDARRQVARAANAALTTLYWQLGKHIHTNVLEGRRAEYGAQIVAAVGRQLEAHHGRGFGEKNLRRMIRSSRCSRTRRSSPHCGDNWDGRISSS